MMSRSILLRTWPLLLLCCLALASCSDQNNSLADAPAAVADDDLSYRNEPLDADSGTPGAAFTSADPGESKPIVRSFENAPPVIPHNVDDLLPITLDENLCLDCHDPEMADDETPPVPASHTYDIRRDRQLTVVNPANYSCTLCHATQADVVELVGNDFEPFFRNEESRTSSNLLDVLNEGAE